VLNCLPLDVLFDGYYLVYVEVHERFDLEYFHEELTPVWELLEFFVLFSGSAPSFHLNM
jgi:hypothetical protein